MPNGQQILGPEAYLYRKDLSDVYRDIEMIKSARQRRETTEAQQTGQRAAYGTEGEPAELSAVYEAKERQGQRELWLKAYDQLHDIATGSGDLVVANEIMKQGWGDLPQYGAMFDVPPKITRMEKNLHYTRGRVNEDMVHPKTNKKIPAGTTVEFVYNADTQALEDILMIGEQYKPPAEKGAGKEGEAMRKLSKDAYGFALRSLKLSKEESVLIIKEFDESGEVAGLSDEQQKYVDDTAEDYIRKFGTDEQWKSFKQARKRMGRKQTPGEPPDETRTAPELEKAGLVAPAGTKTKSSTAEQWKDYVTPR